MTGEAEARTRRWFGRQDSIRAALAWVPDGGQDLIQGLWRYGWHPSLYGPPKTGRTRLVLNLVADMAVPGRNVLSYFPPAVFPGETDPSKTYFVVVNCENPPQDYEDAFWELVGDAPVVRNVEFLHLRAIGGAGLADFTVAANVDQWTAVLDKKCTDCDGSDWRPIDALFVDDVTSTLKANHKDENSYGVWIAQFNELVRATDVRNSLTILHGIHDNSHPGGGFGSMTGQDGLWSYERVGRGDRWRFSVPRPRFPMKEIKPLPVVADGDYRLYIDRPMSDASDGALLEDWPQTQADRTKSMEARVLEAVKAEKSAGREPRAAEVVQLVRKDANAVNRALSSLVSAGQLTVREHRPVGHGGKAARLYSVPDDLIGQADGDVTKVSK